MGHLGGMMWSSIQAEVIFSALTFFKPQGSQLCKEKKFLDNLVKRKQDGVIPNHLLPGYQNIAKKYNN